MAEMNTITPLSNGNIHMLFGDDTRKYQLLAWHHEIDAKVLHLELRTAFDPNETFAECDVTLCEGMSVADAFSKAVSDTRAQVTRMLATVIEDGPDHGSAGYVDGLKHLLRHLGRMLAKLSIAPYEDIAGWRPVCIRFTFGSDEAYDYDRGQYVEAWGRSAQDAFEAFRLAHPNRTGSDLLNCASSYRPDFWGPVKEKFYRDVQPVQTLVSENMYGNKPAGWHTLWVHVPEEHDILCIQQGPRGSEIAGDLEEDGYMDYVAYQVTHMDSACADMYEQGSGTVPLQNMVCERYACLADAIPDVLADLYDDPGKKAVIL